MAAEVDAWAGGLLGLWKGAEENAVKVEDYAVKDADPDALQGSVKRGHQIIKQLGCLSCHLDYGRKDTFRYDAWGTIVRPANLTAGVYRGGRRPVDLYWRLHAGIPASVMPSTANNLNGPKSWDLVNFLKALPYPEMLPADVRNEIYGSK